MAFRDNLRFVQLDEENFEMKFKDFNVTASPSNFNLQSAVATIAQGVGETQRVGEEIFVHRLEARGYISADIGLSTGGTYSKMFPVSNAMVVAMILLDTRPGMAGTVPTASDIFDNYPTGGAYPYPPQNPVYNRLKISGRFKCLARHEGVLNQFFDEQNRTIDFPAYNIKPSATDKLAMDFNGPYSTSVGVASCVTTPTPANQSTQDFPSMDVPAVQGTFNDAEYLPINDRFTVSVEFDPPITVSYNETNVCKNHLYFIVIGEAYSIDTVPPADLTFSRYTMSVYFTDEAAFPQTFAAVNDVPPVNFVDPAEFAEDEEIFGEREPPMEPEVQRSGQAKRSRHNSYFEPDPQKRDISSIQKRERESNKRYGFSKRTKFHFD